MGLTPKELAYRRGVAPEVLDLLAHFESQTNNHDSRDQMVTRVSVLTPAANASDRYVLRVALFTLVLYSRME